MSSSYYTKLDELTLVIAYNEKSQIWISDTLYSKYFSNRTSAKHIIFAYSLFRAVIAKKQQLNSLESSGTIQLTLQQAKAVSVFRNRGATFLLTSAISASLEIILSRAIPDKFVIEFEGKKSPQDAINTWSPIVDVASAFVERLTPALAKGLNNAEQVKSVVSDFTSFMDATQVPNKDIYSEFSKKVRFTN